MLESFADKIAQLCLTHFDRLPKTGKPDTSQWTVLSCIVQENVEGELRVVSLGTGSKCIGQSKLSPKGDILNDSHAEVVCRRSFLRYLLDQIIGANSIETIFEFESGRFRLREGVQFHFFTTCMPCGDATIFGKDKNCIDCGSVLMSQTENVQPAHKKLKIDEDFFRTGAKCLSDSKVQDLRAEGVNYHVFGAVRTKPGRGDRTLSVSCSDKMARWCHVGVQGAALSFLVDKPIFLRTFTIAGGVPYSEESLTRALYERISLKTSTAIPKLNFFQSDLKFKYSKSAQRHQPSPSSIVWCDVTKKALEVATEGKIHGVTKKNRDTKSARLTICKVELYRKTLEILQSYKFNSFDQLKLLSYGQFKRKATTYQNNWKMLVREGFKRWTEKDETLINFMVD